jgi:hypothetical protein
MLRGAGLGVAVPGCPIEVAQEADCVAEPSLGAFLLSLSGDVTR